MIDCYSNRSCDLWDLLTLPHNLDNILPKKAVVIPLLPQVIYNIHCCVSIQQLHGDFNSKLGITSNAIAPKGIIKGGLNSVVRQVIKGDVYLGQPIALKDFLQCDSAHGVNWRLLPSGHLRLTQPRIVIDVDGFEYPYDILNLDLVPWLTEQDPIIANKLCCYGLPKCLANKGQTVNVPYRPSGRLWRPNVALLYSDVELFFKSLNRPIPEEFTQNEYVTTNKAS